MSIRNYEKKAQSVWHEWYLLAENGVYKENNKMSKRMKDI